MSYIYYIHLQNKYYKLIHVLLDETIWKKLDNLLLLKKIWASMSKYGNLSFKIYFSES